MRNVRLRSKKKVSGSVSRATQFPDPSVQVSWGELLDKITILEIKARRLRSDAATANVVRELTMLQASAAVAYRSSPGVASLKDELSGINELLWDIENKIREKEAAKNFDLEFIELARAVYLNNDKRAALKREINRLMKSELIEEKQYTAYS
jgi:hypothetical protein